MAGIFLGREKEKKTAFCSAVLLAAGNSVRMGDVDKIMAPLAGKPAVQWPLEALEKCPLVSEIIIVTRRELFSPMGDLCKDGGISKIAAIVEGGKSRMESVWNGLCAVSRKAKFIATHDGARPMATAELITQVIEGAYKTGACVAALNMRDTVGRVQGGALVGYEDRESLARIQTPQVFDAELLKSAIFKAVDSGREYSDDSAAVQAIGMTVHVSAGSEDNIKLTVAPDMALAAAVLEGRQV